MAKHPKKRRMGRYIPGDIDESLNMTTLAGRTLVSTQFDNVVNERTLVSSIDAMWALANFTPGASIGPVMFGVAHSDYTDAEIQEVIDATASWNEGDKVAQEVAKRQVRKIGILVNSPDGAATGVTTFNDGRKLKTKLNWILLQGQTLRLWAFNMGTSAIVTTVPVLTAEGKAHLWPKG